MLEIVVARYNENLSWLNEINDSVIKTVYNKSDDLLENSIQLKNVGREINTYFNHIVKNYETLNDWIFFCQGNPIDHINYFVDMINNFPIEKYEPKIIIGHCKFYNTAFSNKLVETDNFGKPHDLKNLDISVVWKQLFQNEQQPDKFLFSPGCQFIISAEQIKLREKKFYEKCLQITEDREKSPWEFERIMHYIMNPNFI